MFQWVQMEAEMHLINTKEIGIVHRRDDFNMFYS